MHGNSKIPFVREVKRLNKILKKKAPNKKFFEEPSSNAQYSQDLSNFEKFAFNTGYHSFNRTKISQKFKKDFSMDQPDYEKIFSNQGETRKSETEKRRTSMFGKSGKNLKKLFLKKENIDLFKSLEKFEKFLRTDAKIKKNNSGYPRIKLNVFLKQINK